MRIVLDLVNQQIDQMRSNPFPGFYGLYRYGTRQVELSGDDIMNSKAEALSVAMNRIVRLQAQMTDRILAMAAEVGRLLEVATEREAREFLRARCNLPSSELSTYVRFSKTLSGRDETLRKARVSFPVIKSLVAAEADARDEVLERMDFGARIDVREVAVIRKRIQEARLTPGQILAQQHGKLARAAARKMGDGDAEQFKSELHSFVASIIDMRGMEICAHDVRDPATVLLEKFRSYFGADHRAPEDLKRGSRAHSLSCGHAALEHLAEGTLPWAGGVGELNPDERHPWLLALYALSGHAPTERPRNRNHLHEMPTGMRPTVVELFAGGGGMALGFERAGYDHVALAEFDTHAVATLRKNRPEWTVAKGDIRSIDFGIYRQLDIDVLTGGPPCQPYSIEGKGLGKEDLRDMLPDCVRIVSEIRPKSFVFENVTGLLHSKHADHVADLLRGFRQAGYATDIHRIQAADFGIAQTRSRVLIIGVRKDLATSFRMPPRFPERRANLGDVLVDLMGANGWTGAREWARARREQPVTDKNGIVVAYGAHGSTVVTSRGKRRRNEAAAQIASGYDSTGLPPAAPTEAEASIPGFLPSLTLRMRAKLQDFDEEWEFCGGIQAAAKQIGNAVPPRMAHAIALALYATVNGITWNWDAVFWGEDAARSNIAPPSLVPDEVIAIDALETA